MGKPRVCENTEWDCQYYFETLVFVFLLDVEEVEIVDLQLNERNILTCEE